MPNKVILILGPTCVGKTEFAISLAKALNTEIISADSMQVYKHMDIGTGKPTEEQRMGVKHHMIDVIEPSKGYSVGRYLKDVIPIINGLHISGKTPIITGGTGLYIKAMTRGLFKAPSSDKRLRKELLTMEKEEKGILYETLKTLDTPTSQTIMPTDLRRIIRALEVMLKSRERFSELKAKLTMPFPYDFIKIGLLRDRKELYLMIEKRVDEMIKMGLVDEVKEWLNLNPSETAMQAIGYKELALYLSRGIGIEEAVRLIKRNTKRYAKRQFTWFKKEECINWIDVTGIMDADEMLKKIIKELPYVIIPYGKTALSQA